MRNPQRNSHSGYSVNGIMTAACAAARMGCALALAFACAAASADGNVAYHGDVEGYLAEPAGGGKHPAVILVHEWWGLNDDIRSKARDFAQQGYVALAVDLYNGEATSTPDRARELAGAVRSDQAGAFANLRDAIAFLHARDSVDQDRLATVGWCFGGGWAYQIAKNNLGVQASVIYYGRFNPEDDLAQMRASILGHFAELDRGIKVDDVRAFEANLNTLSGDHQIFIYPNTSHGFANPDNSIYDMAAADLARERTYEFLGRSLR